MERILPLELVGFKELEYDLLDEKGDIVFKKGETLTPNLLMKLSYMKLYKNKPRNIRKANPQKEEETDTKQPEVLQSLISEEAAADILRDTREILHKAYDGVPIKLNEFIKSTKVIIEEVATAVDDIECIDQLRVYDEYTYSHNVNVSSLSTAVGFMLRLSEREIKELALAAFFHDIGKMKIPKEVLNKPAKLDVKEMEIMRRHTSIGYRYIKENFEVPDRIARVALDHHERYGGKGYPNGLSGQLLNKYTQITNIVDIYDALVSDRVYKKGIPGDKVIKIMSTEFAQDFNQEIFGKFLKLANRREKVTEKNPELSEL